MSDGNEARKVFDFYAESEDGIVKTPFGDDTGDLKELYEVADFFAERYGLGGCKSLEEFVEMINSTDPVTINMFKAISVEKNQRELDEINSKKPKDDGRPQIPSKTGRLPQTSHLGHARTPVIKADSGNTGVNRANMKRFLLSFGASPQELTSACVRLDGRKMELRDYGNVDSYALKNMPKDEFRKLMRNISADIKASENFEVSDETLRARKRKQVEDARNQSKHNV